MSNGKETAKEVLWHILSLAGISGIYYGWIAIFFLPYYAAPLIALGVVSLFAAHKLEERRLPQLEPYKDQFLLEAEKEVEEYMEGLQS